MKIADLTCEYLKTPLCIDVDAPVFGWILSGSQKDADQQAYQVRVWDETRHLVWDSGIVESNSMGNVPYEGIPLKSSCRYFWEVESRITYWDEVKKEKVQTTLKSEQDFFETGYYKQTDWKGKFIGETKDFTYHLFRKNFQCGKRIQKAKLYVCGLGHFAFYINGKPVSDHVLEGGWTAYDKTCLYTAYDVTGMLLEGQNAALVKLGDGMYNVPGGRYVYYKRSYGKMKLLVQLELLYEDGSRELVVTDETWRMTKSPILFCCIYGGEDYDGRLLKEEYLSPAYQEEGEWEAAVCVEPPAGVLTAMKMEPVQVMETYQPVSVKQIETGVWRYDLGTNFSGWVRIRLRTNGKMAGQNVVMTPCELITKDGSAYQGKGGRKYQWTYILNEKEEQEFAPDFTYTGFRYVDVTGGIPQGEDAAGASVPVIEKLTGEFIYTAAEQAGDFKCSSQLFNQIHQLVLQAIKSNMKSYFTDCPQREKLPWLEQTHLIGPSIMYNFNVRSLYQKIEMDMGDSQKEDGLIPDICPEYVTGFDHYHKGFLDSPEWGSSCIINPWYVYKRYGDSSLLLRYYDVMKRYLKYLEGMTHHEMLHHGLGDWLDVGPCSPHSQNTPVPVVASCIYYYDLMIMKQTAKLFHYKEDALAFGERMEKVYKEYNLQFLDVETCRYGTGSQAAQAMSLIVGLVPEAYQEKVVSQLRNDIINRNYAITAGDVGHPFLIAAMKKYGMSDLLTRMTYQTETPGYGYQIKNGATTLTERWDGSDPEQPYGSQNHLMLGSIEEWFYSGLGGIELVRRDLPLGEIRIAPHIADGIDQVSIWVHHPYGRISVSWERKGDEAEVNVIIPPNVKASLEDESGKIYQVVGSGEHKYRIGK